jgi:NitT/TauT family transport system substrate-binding protein
VVTRRDFLTAHRETCRAMVEALRAGWRAYLDDAEPANKVMAKLNPSMELSAFAQSAEMQKELVESPDTRLHGLGTMTEQRWATLVQQLLDLVVISQPVPAHSCFVNLD